LRALLQQQSGFFSVAPFPNLTKGKSEMIVKCAICKKDFYFPDWFYDRSPWTKYCCRDCVEEKKYNTERIKKSVMNEVKP